MHVLALLGLIPFISALPLVEKAHDYHLEERQLPPGDPCGRLVGTSGAYSPSTILACLNTIPFDPAVRDNIMGVAAAIYSLDVFAANQLGDDEESANQGIDIQQEFARINSTNYQSDYAFQEDLSAVMSSLNDGHHFWSSCYDSFFPTRHALPIVSFSSDPQSTEPNVYLAPDLSTFINTAGFQQIYATFGLSADQLAGLRVVQIEGKPVWDYLEDDLLPLSGVYTDKQQRMNSLFSSYVSDGGAFGRTPGRFTSTRNLERNNLTMIVENGSGQERTVVIPWITIYNSRTAWSYSSGQAFWNANCDRPVPIPRVDAPTNGTTPTPTPPPSPRLTEAQLQQLALQSYRLCPIDRSAVSYPLPANLDPTRSAAYIGGRDVLFFILPESQTGVVYMPTFLPDPLSNGCINRFLVDLLLGLRNFTTAGVDNILVDTSNNGGGSVLLSQAAQRLFTGQELLEENNFESVFRRAPLAEALHQVYLDNPGINPGGFYNPTTFRAGNSTDTLAAGTNFFQPGQSFEINGRTLQTSNRLSDTIDPIEMLDAMFDIPDQPPFAHPNIVFTGNGLCGSACASFTNFLIEYYNATAYINAAQPSLPIEFTAFAAGQASTTGQIYQEAAAIGFTNTAMLPRLEHAGEFGFALRAGISPRIAPGTFLQYRSFPAQERFALTRELYLNQVDMWEYVAGQVFQ